ncbi:hypothetical protein GCM10027037_11910 [Mucilaginibacter koreensis]
MAYKYLQLFLDARLFTIAEDNSTYQFLTATIPVFEKSLLKTKSKIIASTLVALDQDIPHDDPILEEVEDLLKKKWQLLRNKYPERPKTLLRAIILEALHSVTKQNPELANIIWLTGSNYFQFVNERPESALLKDWLSAIGAIAEEISTKEWELVDNAKSINIPEFTIGKLQLTNVSFEKGVIKNGLNEASMNGEQITQNTSNGHYNNQGWGNLRQEWVDQFSAKASETFFTVFSNGFNSLTKALNNLQIDKPINDFFTAFRNDLTKTLTSTLKSTEKLRLRSHILWWKEALYSNSGNMSYREMTAPLISLSMAKDLGESIPPLYPISVDYILRETVLTCIKEDEKKTFNQLLNEFSNLNIDYSLNLIEEKVGRISITQFLQLLVIKKETITNFKQRTGIDESIAINYAGLAVIILHDIQSNKIAAK